MNDSILKRIISHIKENNKKRHTIIINDKVSKKFISSSLKTKGIIDFELYKNNEYIFKTHNEEIKYYKNKDMAFLEDILYETNNKLKTHNFMNEAENIYECINNIFLEKKIIISKNKHVNFNKLFQNNILSYESQIFLEILKSWVSYTNEENSYVNKYMQLIYEDLILFSDADHHVINLNNFFDIEKDWIQKNIPSLFIYNNKIDQIKNKDDLPKINNKVYETYDFNSHEDELEFVFKDISKIILKNPLINIALINNDRYFARRLRALLARNKIEINDESGWLLSTSSCCSYINNILDYFFENNNYLNLRDIIKSPYFKLDLSNENKKEFLKKIFHNQKGDIESHIEDYFDKHDPVQRLFIKEKNPKNLFTFKDFSSFIMKKISDFESNEAIKDDVAGKEFFKVLDNLKAITKKDMKKMSEWSKLLKNKLETNTFSSSNNSKIIYTDINHALLNDYDKIYINSMSSKNYPRKVLNNFSEKIIIYSDFSIKSNLIEKENINDFCRLSKQADKICLTFHKTDNNEIYSKSKFKILIDHITEISVLEKKENTPKFLKKNKNEDFIYLDETVKFLTYRDIENYIECKYCFYQNKKFRSISDNLLLNKYLIFGNYVHSVIDSYAKKNKKKDNVSNIISDLIQISNDKENEYYLKENSPYELKLWKDLLPKIATDFFYSTDKLAKSDFMSEITLKKNFLDNITLGGRYDMKYLSNGKQTICDFKTSSNIPSKRSILLGGYLQLPFYSLLNPSVDIFEYYFINVSQKTTKRISFQKNELNELIEIISNTIQEIKLDLENKTKYYLIDSYDGCENCGFEVLKKQSNSNTI